MKNLKLEWLNGACGLYADFLGYTIIDQNHPKLPRYEITKEFGEIGQLEPISYAQTIQGAKDEIYKRRIKYAYNDGFESDGLSFERIKLAAELKGWKISTERDGKIGVSMSDLIWVWFKHRPGFEALDGTIYKDRLHFFEQYSQRTGKSTGSWRIDQRVTDRIKKALGKQN